MVLALLQGWTEGSVSLRYDELAVDAVMAPPDAAPLAGGRDRPLPVQIRSPAVGVFTPRVAAGKYVKSTEAVGVVEAPGRSTLVFPPRDGKLIDVASPGAFVEYEQQVAALEPAVRE